MLTQREIHSVFSMSTFSDSALVGKLKLRVCAFNKIGVTLLLQSAGNGGAYEATVAGDVDFVRFFHSVSFKFRVVRSLGCAIALQRRCAGTANIFLPYILDAMACLALWRERPLSVTL